MIQWVLVPASHLSVSTPAPFVDTGRLALFLAIVLAFVVLTVQPGVTVRPHYSTPTYETVYKRIQVNLPHAGTRIYQGQEQDEFYGEAPSQETQGQRGG